MYRDTMALKGDPFSPRIELTPDNRDRIAFLTNLHCSPLRLDLCEQLRPLFCDRILGLDAHIRKFRRLMRKLDYSFDPRNGARRAPSSSSGGRRVRARPRWAPSMNAEIARRPGDPLRAVSPPEPADETPSAFRTTLDAMAAEIAQVPRDTPVAALIRNVTQDTLNAAITRFNELPHWPRLFVLTTSNLKLLAADARMIGGKAEIEPLDLRNVEPGDAEANVAHRVPQFRDPDRPEIREVSGTFSFPPGPAGRLVQHRTDGAAPVLLRQLNAHFRSVLTDRAEAQFSRPAPPVAEAPAEALAGYLLSERDVLPGAGG